MLNVKSICEEIKMTGKITLASQVYIDDENLFYRNILRMTNGKGGKLSAEDEGGVAFLQIAGELMSV
jgi:hypothetical protein